MAGFSGYSEKFFVYLKFFKPPENAGFLVFSGFLFLLSN